MFSRRQSGIGIKWGFLFICVCVDLVRVNQAEGPRTAGSLVLFHHFKACVVVQGEEMLPFPFLSFLWRSYSYSFLFLSCCGDGSSSLFCCFWRKVCAKSLWLFSCL